MASRKKLEVQETPDQESQGSKIKLEEGLVLTTTLALVAGIVAILLKLAASYGMGPFASFYGA